ncbi:MAG: TIM barrel protein [Micromonosporaceae bacterium]
MRVAAAPISWGVCEVPGWGHQLTPERVLTEMRQLGITATEFGPYGYLPTEPGARSELLARHGLAAVGGFVPVVLHQADRDPLDKVRAALDGFGDATMLVLAAATGQPGYDQRPVLDQAGWQVLSANLDRVADYAAERGVLATLHPHVGTMIETADEVRRVLDGARAPLCLDTGHLLLGGTDPAALARAAPERIAHVHLKDVQIGIAEQIRSGELRYTDAVRQGVFCPLGQGDVDIAGIVSALAKAGYRGWYVLEQDTVLDAEPAGDTGPAHDVRASLSYLERL